MGTYVRPTTLSAALECRATGAEVLAGGTDFWPVRVGKPAYGPTASTLLDLSAVTSLADIVPGKDSVRVGALATWSGLADAPLAPAFRALQQAAREVGGRQIQNRGTIGGNLCNASPAADGVPPLLALDASVELASVRGTRVLPLASFLTGPRRTALAADEVMVALLVPAPHAMARSAFIKLGARKYQLISIVMGAAVWRIEDGRVADAAIAIGACSPAAQRLGVLEAALRGAPLSEIGRRFEPEHLSALTPIADIRADVDYRRDAAEVVVRRLLAQFVDET